MRSSESILEVGAVNNLLLTAVEDGNDGAVDEEEVDKADSRLRDRLCRLPTLRGGEGCIASFPFAMLVVDVVNGKGRFPHPVHSFHLS
jgi:hypothetical protein